MAGDQIHEIKEHLEGEREQSKLCSLALMILTIASHVGCEQN